MPRSGVQMVLSHTWNTLPDYALNAMTLKRKGEFTILDNEAFELKGRGLGPRSLMQIALDLVPDEIIVPDDINSPSLNVAMAQEYLPILRDRLDVGTRYMVVPHGRTPEEYVDNLDRLLRLRPDTIGIVEEVDAFVELANPTLQRRHVGRPEFIDWLKITMKQLGWAWSDYAIHCLGMTEDPTELRWLAELGVRSLDTCKPIVWGMSGVLLRQWDGYAIHGLDTPTYVGRPFNYFEAPVDQAPPAELESIMDNVKWCFEQVGCEAIDVLR